MPSRPKPREKILKARLAGATREETARKLHVSVRTVDEVMRDARREGYLTKEVDALTWKDRLKDKSITAVEAGLNCNKDPYRRADVGVKVLKGIGEFTETHQGLHLLVSTVPKDWVQKFPVSNNEEEQQP